MRSSWKDVFPTIHSANRSAAWVPLLTQALSLTNVRSRPLADIDSCKASLTTSERILEHNALNTQKSL
jgi:hypothetical protein